MDPVHDDALPCRRRALIRSHFAPGALALLLTLGSFSGCDQAPRDPAPGKPAGAANIPPVPVAVEPAWVGSIASHYETTATLEVEKQADVLARVEGVVEKILVEEGDSVSAGSKLLEIDNDQYRLLLNKATATRKSLESRFQRLEKIIDDQVVSADEFETARNDLESARADEGLARLNLDYTTVRSPFAGRVITRHVDVGHKVSPDSPLFTVADFDPLLARVRVPSKEFRKIRLDQKVELVLDSTGEKLEGRVLRVSPTIDSNTGTIKVTVEVPEYPAGIRPGDFAEVKIVTQLNEDSTLVHRRAVFLDKGEQVVYVARGERAERRPVQVGFTDDQRAEILSGVRAGDQVVVAGQRGLKDGAPIKVHEGETPLTSTRPAGKSQQAVNSG